MPTPGTYARYGLEDQMISFDNLSPLEMKKRIRYRMGGGDQLDNDAFFDDVARIGSLLSSEILCMAYCQHLNDALIAHAKAKGVFEKMSSTASVGGPTLKVPKGFGPKQIYKENVADNDLTLTAERHKHHKVLSGFLAEFEASHRFNEGSHTFKTKNKAGAVVSLKTKPAKAVTLPGFVDPPVFRTNLLDKARHFKDPTVGSMHGEFTHRIQWYIVCEYGRLTKQLDHSPADIFQACARPIFVAEKTTIWDIVFEGDGAKDFRSPEHVTEFLLRASRDDHPRHQAVWFLAALTEGRYAKREIEKARA